MASMCWGGLFVSDERQRFSFIFSGSGFGVQKR
jgi:hypothetical protein